MSNGESMNQRRTAEAEDYPRGYTSSDGTEPITASALRNVTRDAAHTAGIYLVDMATGERTPILAAMVDREENVYLYTEPA
jgi:hypothetical protein